MIKAVVFDFSRVLLFATDRDYTGDLNPLHIQLLSQDPHYNFLKYFYLNHELMSQLTHYRSRFKLYIFTSGRIQEAPAIAPDLAPVFDAVLSAEDMGTKKSNPSAYQHLVSVIGYGVDEVLFVDDSPINIEAARSAGLQTHLYTDNRSFLDVLNHHANSEL